MPDTPDYRPMWTELGLDLDKHDALLGVLGQLYADTYLSQDNRPEAMGYFDFVMGEVHGLRIKELIDAKAAGRIVVGSFCVFVPEELVLAVASRGARRHALQLFLAHESRVRSLRPRGDPRGRFLQIGIGPEQGFRHSLSPPSSKASSDRVAAGASPRPPDGLPAG